MAGGQGTRLRPLTSNQPKPMVPVVNKPCLQHTLELLQRHDIDQVIMTLAFLPKHIRSYFGDGSGFGVHIEYSVEEVPAGTAGSVGLAREALDDTFLVVSGDALTDFDLTALVDFHRERKAMVTIALKSVVNPLEFGVVVVDDEGRIRRFLEKPGWGQVFSDTVNTGIYVLEPEVLDHIPAGEPYDFSRDLFPRLFETQERLYGRVCEGYWQDIGSLEQYLQANRDALDGKVHVTPPGVRLRGNIWVAQAAEIEALDDVKGPAVIGEDVVIEVGAQVLGHTVLGDHTVIRRGSQVVGSVLGENVYVASGAVVAGAVLGNGVEVRENAHVSQGAVVGDRSSIGRGAEIGNNVKVYPFKNVEAGSEVRSSLVWETRGPSTLFGRDGVRGLANVDLTPEIAMRLAMSYGTMFAKGNAVTVSRDGHEASRVLSRAIVSGLNSTGVTVRNLTTATPAVNRSDLKAGNASGSVHVQMCADAPEHIVLLFSEPPGLPIDSRRERAIENHYFREDFRRAAFDEMGEVVYPPGVWERYASLLLENWDTAVIRRRQPRVVLDVASPVQGPFFPSIIGRLGVEVITVASSTASMGWFALEDGVPISAARVGELVLATEADMGAILDPGAERLYVVDDQGTMVDHSSLLLVLLEAASKQSPSGSIALPLSVTRWAEKVVGSNRVTVRRTKCSTSALLWEAMRPNTILAADAEGRYAYPSVLPAMDGLYALGKVIELLATCGIPMSQIIQKAPHPHVAHVVQECPWNLKGAVMRRVTAGLSEARISLIDGVKVFLGKDDWALVLPDSEEAAFHVYSEAADELQASELAESYRAVVAQAIAETDRS
jgi:mannose-1-phosphate guanylyltransferase/phosphomannomutase